MLGALNYYNRAIIAMLFRRTKNQKSIAPSAIRQNLLLTTNTCSHKLCFYNEFVLHSSLSSDGCIN